MEDKVEAILILTFNGDKDTILNVMTLLEHYANRASSGMLPSLDVRSEKLFSREEIQLAFNENN